MHFATWGTYDHFNAKIPSFNYLDLAATWNVNKILQIRAGANNILDKDPALIDTVIVSGSAANTNSLYDMFGRQLFVAFTAKFLLERQISLLEALHDGPICLPVASPDIGRSIP